jgi:hypothetical protein
VPYRGAGVLEYGTSSTPLTAARNEFGEGQDENGDDDSPRPHGSGGDPHQDPVHMVADQMGRVTLSAGSIASDNLSGM